MSSNRKLNIYEELENLRNENGALKRAVDSKSAAIGILRTELEECQRERDEFRMMIETHAVSLPIQSCKDVLPCPEKIHSAILSGSENTLAQLLSQSKEENKQLRQELTDIKCRLHDACSDLKILRAEKSRKTGVNQSRLSIATSSQLAQKEREIHIQQMEHLSSKCQAQENDVRCLLEEREELISERDDIRRKLHRLNYILNVLLSRDYYSKRNRPQHRTIDIDAIITENRYLQQRMKQLDDEKSIAIASLSKYKSALENCRTNISSSRKLRSSDNLIMSPKQVSEFLSQYEGEVGENAEKNLKFICVALIDALNQKSRAVKTQKAANKMLIERIAELEKRLVCSAEDENDDNSSKNGPNLISASLLEGYNPASAQIELENVDVTNVLQEIRSNLEEETSPRKGNEQPKTLVAPESTKEDMDSSVATSGKNNETSSPDSSKKDKLSDNPGCHSTTTISGNNENSPEKSHPLSSSESEEIVPLENLDSYISNLKQRKSKKDSHANTKETVVEKSIEKPEEKERSPGVGLSRDSSDTSFDLDISDYDSDDDNLEVTLQNWQNECEKSTSNKIIAKLSPKKSVPSLLKSRNKLKKGNVELPDKLLEILK